jgi:hypothetical protein
MSETVHGSEDGTHVGRRASHQLNNDTGYSRAGGGNSRHTVIDEEKAHEGAWRIYRGEERRLRS